MAAKTIPATSPVVQVSAKNLNEVLHAAWTFPVLKALRETTILAVTDEDITEAAERAHEAFGTKVVRIPASKLRAQYDGVGDMEAAAWAERWRRGARRVQDVSANTLIDCARMYVAVTRAMGQMKAQTVAVDCPSIRNQSDGLPMPCMAHFQLNNDGVTSVCAANIDMAIAQTMIRTISHRPSFKAVPGTRTPGKGVTLAHSATTTRLLGAVYDPMRYELARADEAKNSVNVHVLLPHGEQMTLVDLDLANRQMRIAGAESAAGPKTRDKCRTCIFARTAHDLTEAGSPPNRPCVAQFGAYAKRLAFAAKLARIQPAGITDASA